MSSDPDDAVGTTADPTAEQNKDAVAKDPDVVGSSMEGTPMEVSSSKELEEEKSKKGLFGWCGCGTEGYDKLLPYQKMATDEKVLKRSVNVLRFATLATAINAKLLQPNYAIMVRPEASDDSFSSTAPFDVNSATYFIPMMSQLGIAIAGLVVGPLSDKIGRKPVLLWSTLFAAVGSLVKYFVRESFWGFNAANFVTGFFSGSLPAAMAYVSDVFETETEKQSELGILVASFVTGSAGGGIIAILMEDSGLFTPLFVGAGITFLSALLIFKLLIEPGNMPILSLGPRELSEEEEVAVRPDKIDNCVLWNIVGGALADNIGSCGLFPLCLAPLALDQYLMPFLESGQEPIMTITGYKWLSVMVALLVVPSTLATPWLFRKFGAAGSCVAGNFATALVTLALLLIGNGERTTSYFAGFVTVMYAGYPFTVISQLTTGPMLDFIAPVDQRGFVQGLNSAVMGFGMAFAPWVLGILADAVSTTVAISTGIGVSVLAGVVNAPLMWRKGFGPAPKKLPPERRPLVGENKELVEKALRGELVPFEALDDINIERVKKGLPRLVVHPKTYAEDKEMLEELDRNAEATFKYRKALNERWLEEVSKPDRKEELPEICDQLNAYLKTDAAAADEINGILGQWFTDYLKDNGYYPHTNPLLVKQLIMSAFPPITQDEQVTPENIEETLANVARVYGHYIRMRDDRRYSLDRLLVDGGVPAYYG